MLRRGKCDVQGCAVTRLRTPRLCPEHAQAWHDSHEETETRRTHDFIGPYQRWLKRIGAMSGGTVSRCQS